MRKFIYGAVFAALGYTMVSCDTDNVEALTTAPATTKQTVTMPPLSAVVRVDSLTTSTQTAPGPGDDVVPIKPPKP